MALMSLRHLLSEIGFADTLLNKAVFFISSRIQTHFDHEMTSGLPRVGHLIAVIAL